MHRTVSTILPRTLHQVERNASCCFVSHSDIVCVLATCVMALGSNAKSWDSSKQCSTRRRRCVVRTTFSCLTTADSFSYVRSSLWLFACLRNIDSFLSFQYDYKRQLPNNKIFHKSGVSGPGRRLVDSQHTHHQIQLLIYVYLLYATKGIVVSDIRIVYLHPVPVSFRSIRFRSNVVGCTCSYCATTWWSTTILMRHYSEP